MAEETKQDKARSWNPNKRPNFLQRNLLCKKPTKDQPIDTWHHKRKNPVESSKKLDPMRFIYKRLDEPVVKFRVIAKISLHFKTPASNLFFVLLVYAIQRKAVKHGCFLIVSFFFFYTASIHFFAFINFMSPRIDFSITFS